MCPGCVAASAGAQRSAPVIGRRQGDERLFDPEQPRDGEAAQTEPGVDRQHDSHVWREQVKSTKDLTTNHRRWFFFFLCKT